MTFLFLINLPIPFEIEYKNFIMGAKEYVKADDKGVLFLKLVEAGDGGREEHLKEGEVQTFTMFLYVLKNQPKVL
jgi:hypothetical protein